MNKMKKFNQEKILTSQIEANKNNKLIKLSSSRLIFNNNNNLKQITILISILIISISTILNFAAEATNSQLNDDVDDGILITSNNNNNNNKNQKLNDNQKQQLLKAVDKQQQQQTSANSALIALENELNSIIQQHPDDASIEANNRQLAEIILSRLMHDNLTGQLNNNLSPSQSMSANNNNGDALERELLDSEQQELINNNENNNNNNNNNDNDNERQSSSLLNSNNNNNNKSNVYDAIKLKKLFSMIDNYYENLNYDLNNNGRLLNVQFPHFQTTNSEMATMKRATAKINNYLHNQRPQQSITGYPRTNYDFGLGKRPDGNFYSRYGDLSSSIAASNGGGSGIGGGSSGIIQPVSQFGKRPSSHRYDFGLGKRVASPTYPRYDFGLGKRAPNRIRYDFGLGKK